MHQGFSLFPFFASFRIGQLATTSIRVKWDHTFHRYKITFALNSLYDRNKTNQIIAILQFMLISFIHPEHSVMYSQKQEEIKTNKTMVKFHALANFLTSKSTIHKISSMATLLTPHPNLFCVWILQLCEKMWRGKKTISKYPSFSYPAHQGNFFNRQNVSKHV